MLSVTHPKRARAEGRAPPFVDGWMDGCRMDGWMQGWMEAHKVKMIHRYWLKFPHQNQAEQNQAEQNQV